MFVSPLTLVESSTIGLVGVNINMTLLPVKLKRVGYKSHMISKWHEGFYKSEYLPVNRGFDTSSSFLEGGKHHMNQRVCMIHNCVVDFWKNQSPDSGNGTYDAYTYRYDLTDVLNEHDPTQPFFYLPLHNVHTPFEAPDE